MTYRLAEAQDHMLECLNRLALPLNLLPESASLIRKSSRLISLAKSDHLLRAADPVTALFFVATGLIRYYYIALNGTLSTGQFFGSGAFITDVGGFVQGTPATQNLDSLEPSEVLWMDRQVIRALLAKDHALERATRVMMEQALIGSQRRTEALLCQTAEERYRTFLATRPKIVDRVPLYMVASYLGISPEALSRIRARRSKGGFELPE
jgi:CRP-like cAMP-binding protein